ncbi:hypothetical protein BC827DRAFT_1159476 [Russula dissimulans]|nr:hypothetical protein BC827DRAFT_1159476 [Russula dissimulans]
MALKRYISLQNNPHLTPPQLEKSLWNVLFTFCTLPIWNKVKFLHFDPITGRTTTVDTIHANPECKGQGHDKQAHQVCGHFDTVLVNEEGHGREHGIDGYSVAQVKAIISIPNCYPKGLFNDGVKVPEHLAYIEWYSLLDIPDPNHGMFKVSS